MPSSAVTRFRLKSVESIMTGAPHTLSVSKKPKLSRQAKCHLDELLDEALAETFPASDAPAMLEPAPGLAQAEQEEQSLSHPLKRSG
jgi:hypothetical protein